MQFLGFLLIGILAIPVLILCVALGAVIGELIDQILEG